MFNVISCVFGCLLVFSIKAAVTTTDVSSSNDIFTGITSPCDSSGCPPVAWVPGYGSTMLQFVVDEDSADVPSFCPHGTLVYPDDFTDMSSTCIYFMYFSLPPQLIEKNATGV